MLPLITPGEPGAGAAAAVARRPLRAISLQASVSLPAGIRSIVTLIGSTVSPASPFSKVAAATEAGMSLPLGRRSPHRIRASRSSRP